MSTLAYKNHGITVSNPFWDCENFQWH
uniref:Uncharacterized protein n=1 Tax=Arundo donax TaxID=35708 RepID=A0A0A9AUQ2_ARUDO